jgi:pilus assembly protein TadC
VVALFISGWPGLGIGAVVGLVAHRYLARLEPAATRRERSRAAVDLPYAADLLAAALHAGLPTDHAVRLVADAVDGPVGDRLASAVTRSAESGAALAAAFTRLADEQRAARADAVEAAARRAGVLVVLPLGLCFLPAFVFAGLVPVIVAVLGDVLR